MGKRKIFITMVLALFLCSCSSADDIKKLNEMVNYYRTQCQNLQNEVNRLKSHISKLEAEVERSRNLHKKMLE